MLMVCLTCSTRFAVGCHYCPGCTSTRCLPDYEYDKEAGVAKITVAGGPSNVAQDEQEAREAEAAVEATAQAGDAVLDAPEPEVVPEAPSAPVEPAAADVAPVEDAPKPAAKKAAAKKA